MSTCPRHGEYASSSGSKCPVCEGRRGPHRAKPEDLAPMDDRELNRALRRRPPSGPVDDEEDL